MTASITIATPPTGPQAPAAPAASTPAPAPANNSGSNPASNAVPPASTPEARPEWLPSKFKDVKQMAEAYTALEKRFTQGNQQQPDTNTPPANTQAPNQPDTNAPPANTQQPPAQNSGDVKDLLTANGFDYAKLQTEFAQQGKFSDETYNGLVAKFGKGAVDGYIAGQQAISTAYENQIVSLAGNRDDYTKMVSWAAANLEPAAKQAYNDAINSGDMARAQQAVNGLKLQFTQANGSEPNLMGGARSDGTTDGYTSWAQVTADMRNPKYANDKAFRAEVEDKLRRSNLGPRR